MLISGCSESTDPTVPEGTVHTVRDALLSKRLNDVYPHLSRKTRSMVTEAHLLLTEQNEAVSKVYPPEHRFGARGAYPAGVLSAKTPKALMAALIRDKAEKLKLGPGLAFGLTARGSATVLDTSATVATQSGETVHLNLEDGQWRVTIWEPAIAQVLERIQANHTILKSNLKAIQSHKKQKK
jgi:hypothetical protein